MIGAPGAAAGSRFATYAPKPVDVRRIERELTEMWSEPPAGAAGDVPVTRACMSNLIVFAPDLTDAESLASELLPIVERHPSRILMLVGETQADQAEIEAYVSALCYLGERGRQVCSEHVVIGARKAARRRLPSAVRPLVLGDLPTALWWAPGEPPGLAGDLFRELADMATQVVFDSLGWPDPARGLVATARWASGADAAAGISDLAWARLAPWRSLIGQALDPAVAPGALVSLHEVEIEHAPEAASQAWLLAGWLASRLAWRLEAAQLGGSAHAEWRFAGRAAPVRLVASASPAVAQAGVEDALRVRLRWGASERPEQITVARSGDDRLEIVGEGAGSRGAMVVPQRSRAALVARELPDLGRDPIYRQSLEAARRMFEKGGA